MLNIAHRGFTRRFPDNTLEAFQAAIELGVDGIECDVQETEDNCLVVFHEAELLGTEIGRLTAAQIQQVRLEGKYKIPTLPETIGLCRKRVRLILDLKQVRSPDRFLQLTRASVEPDDIGLALADQNLALRLSNLAPEYRRGIIVDDPGEDPVKILESCRCDIIGVAYPYVTEEMVTSVHRKGCFVFVWGCGRREEIKAVLKLEIDGLVSDVPDLVKDELGIRG